MASADAVESKGGQNAAHSIVYTFPYALLGLVASSSATGSMMDHRRTTYFTFSAPVQMPGVILPAGTYIFEVVNPDSSADVVSVRSRDRSKVHLMQFTRFVERPSKGKLLATVSLGETRDAPAPVKTVRNRDPRPLVLTLAHRTPHPPPCAKNSVSTAGPFSRCQLSAISFRSFVSALTTRRGIRGPIRALNRRRRQDFRFSDA